MMKSLKIVLVITFCFFLVSNIFANKLVVKKKEKIPWVAFLHLKFGVYPTDENWGCFPRGFIPPEGYPWTEGDPVRGEYQHSYSIDIAFEISRPLWALQLNFGIKPSKIRNAFNDYKYRYKSNYLSYGILFFPLKQDNLIQPFILSKFGMNYQGQNLEDNGRFLAVGIGSRVFFSKNLGVELLVEKLSLVYRNIPLGQGRPWHFKVSPIKISFGFVYKI